MINYSPLSVVVDILISPNTTHIEAGKEVTFVCEYQIGHGNPYLLKPFWFMNGDKVNPRLSRSKKFNAAMWSNTTISKLTLTDYTVALNSTEITCGFETSFTFAGKIVSDEATLFLLAHGELGGFSASVFM